MLPMGIALGAKRPDTHGSGATLHPRQPERLVLDQYSKGTGYQPFVTDDLGGGQFAPGPDFSFPFRFRHGSILPLAAGEHDRLEAALGKPGSVK